MELTLLQGVTYEKILIGLMLYMYKTVNKAKVEMELFSTKVAVHSTGSIILDFKSRHEQCGGCS